ncbi:MAG: hypothetical protein HYZ49_18720 [Chloroflexi bacterium]|nr:hypothetical protein [Chloroflexota bacterium]
MSTTTSSSSVVSSPKVALGKLLWVGPLAIVGSVVANVFVRFVAVAVLNPPAEFLPLNIAQPIVLTVVGVVLAIVAFALVARFARNPIRTYQIVAAVALVVSLAPDVLLLANAGSAPFPGVNVGTVGALMLMHGVAWAICVAMFTNLTLEK